ncbi:MAG: ATP-binding protein, partial [bacterium]|nr:ATP-binding protein [bacterium]
MSKINIFAASSGELDEERKELIHIVDSIHKQYGHLTLEVIKWETGIPSGSYEKQRVQDEINPLLEDSPIVIVIFYSKLGKFTLEEYNLAREKKKKVFLYFKQGFSPKSIEESKNYQQVLGFRNSIETENKSLYRDYHSIDQFKLFIREDLGLYLKQEFSPAPSVSKPGIPKYLTPLPVKSVELVGRERELEEMTRRLEHAHRVLLVNGLGGVGKTELCKRYFRDHCGDYRHLAWVDVTGTVRESVTAAFTAEIAGFREDDTVDERFEKIMDLLTGLDTQCLLVADNIDNPGDPDLDGLRRLPVKVMANSRLTIEGFENHPLDFLSAEG